MEISLPGSAKCIPAIVQWTLANFFGNRNLSVRTDKGYMKPVMENGKDFKT